MTHLKGVGHGSGTGFRRKDARRAVSALAVWLVLVLLLSIAPVAHAAPAVSISPSSGIVGSAATFSGTGGTPLTKLTRVGWVDSAGNIMSLCTTTCPTTDATGAFSFSFSIPGATNGTASIAAFGAAFAGASATFRVVSHQVLSPTAASPGSTISDHGTGFDSGGTLSTFTVGPVTPGGSCPGAATTGVGNFSCTFSVPFLRMGTYPVNATDDLGDSNIVLLRIIPGGAVNATFVQVGDIVGVFIDGFPAFAPVELFWDPTLPSNTTVATGFTDTDGTAFFSIAVPPSPYGPHTLRAYYSPGVMQNFTLFVIGKLVLTPDAGFVGMPGVWANGTGFPASSTVVLRWDPGTAVQSTLGTIGTAANGTFSLRFVVPSASFGSHRVSGFVAGTSYANASFRINEANLTLNVITGPPGGTFAAAMVGFSASSTINVVWDPLLLTQTNLGTGTSDARGALNLTGLKVPSTAVPGPHVVGAIDANGVFALASFIVGPWITLSPVAGPVGSTFVVSGWTYPTGKLIWVNWTASGPNLAVVGPLIASGAYRFGNFSATVTVPNFPFGSYLVQASTAGGASFSSASFQVIPSLVASPASGPVGTAVRVSAQGLSASVVAVAYLDGVTSGIGAITNALGSVSFTLPFPPAPAGVHEITVVDVFGHTTNMVPFTVIPSVHVSSFQGYPGDSVTVSVMGFAALTVVTISWNGTGTSVQVRTDSTGSASGVVFAIPTSAIPGSYPLAAYDAAGNVAPSVTVTVLPLSVPMTVAPANGAFVNRSSPTLAWNPLPNGGVTYTVQISTNASFGPGTTTVSGIAGTSWTLAPTADGWYYWRVEAVAPGGGTSGFSATASFLIDTTPPIASLGAVPALSAVLTISLPFNASDPSPGSGVQGVQLWYSADSGATWVAYAGGTLFAISPISFTAPAAGSYGFIVVAVDRAGNHEARPTAAQGRTLIDPTAPATHATFSGPIGLRGWYTGPVLVTLGAVGGPSGVAAIQYQLDNGSWVPYGAPWWIASAGNHTLAFRAVSGTGVVGPATTIAVPIDLGIFTWTITAPAAGATTSGLASLSATVGAISGVVTVSYSIDHGPWVALTTASSGAGAVRATGSFHTEALAPGTHLLTLQAANAAGQSATTSETFGVNNPNYFPAVFVGTLVAVVLILVGLLLRRSGPGAAGATAPAAETPPSEGPDVSRGAPAGEAYSAEWAEPRSPR